MMAAAADDKDAAAAADKDDDGDALRKMAVADGGSEGSIHGGG